MLDSDPEDETPVPTMPRPIPASKPDATPEPPPSAGSAGSSRASSPGRPDKSAAWAGLLGRMKPDAPKGALKRAQRKGPAPARARPPETPPATPAKRTSPEDGGGGGKRPWLPRDEWVAQRRREEAGPDGFDVRVHGYWLTKSRGLVFRCPDGRELPATGVDAFDL